MIQSRSEVLKDRLPGMFSKGTTYIKSLILFSCFGACHFLKLTMHLEKCMKEYVKIILEADRLLIK